MNTDRVECDELSVKTNDVARLRKFILFQWNERDGLTTRSYQRCVDEQNF